MLPLVGIGACNDGHDWFRFANVENLVRYAGLYVDEIACLVVDEYGIDPSLQRLLESMGQPVPHDKPILEINPHHPIILKMKNESDEQRFSDWSWILFDQSMLSLGEQLENPVKFVNRLNDLLAQL